MADEKKHRQVYLLEEMTGEYEDRHTRVLECYFDYEKACKERDRLTAIQDEMRKKYESIDYDVDFLKDSVYHLYLKDINVELYEAAVKAENDDEFCKTFDWDKYYDTRDGFYNDEELFNEYAKKYGCTEQNMEDFKTMEYVTDELFYDFPFYYVPNYPIDLID